MRQSEECLLCHTMQQNSLLLPIGVDLLCVWVFTQWSTVIPRQVLTGAGQPCWAEAGLLQTQWPACLVQCNFSDALLTPNFTHHLVWRRRYTRISENDGSVNVTSFQWIALYRMMNCASITAPRRSSHLDSLELWTTTAEWEVCRKHLWSVKDLYIDEEPLSLSNFPKQEILC